MKPHHVMFGGIIMILACTYGVVSALPILGLATAVAGGK